MAKKATTKTAVTKLEPILRFREPTTYARCKRAFATLLNSLYELEITAENVPELTWFVDSDSGTVRLLPIPADVTTPPWRTQPEICFSVDGYCSQLRKLKGPKNAVARKKLVREFHNWIAHEVVDAFESELVEIEYSYFNSEDCPFEISVALTADKQIEKPVTFFSNTRKVKSRKRKKAKPKLPAPRPDYSKGGWQRFYFDDGKTRRFWYIRSKGATQTIIQGNLGTIGKTATKKLASPKAAKASVAKAIKTKTKAGYIAYDAEEFQYDRNNRRRIPAIKKAMAEFEKENGYRLDEQFRNHLLSTNGGWFYENVRCVSVPGRPERNKTEVHRVFGFAADQDITRECSWQIFQPGHVLFAEGEHKFTIDPAGTIFLLFTEGFDHGIFDDDRILHYEVLTPYPIAHCFDEFLTRLVKFPNDTNAATKAKPEKTNEQKLHASNKQLEKARKAAKSLHYRRFFFDDGRERKFWNIETNGKKFTTSYARLGAKPSSTTKSFSSVEQADAAAKKIIGQKLKKGYQEVLPDVLFVERPKKFRKATAAAIAKFEKQLGYKLPEEYRNFLRTQNGGTPVPDSISIPGLQHIASVTVGSLLGLYPKSVPGSLAWGLEVGGKVLPDGHLPIAGDGDWFTLSLKKKPGCVFFWDHESDDIYENDPNDRFRISAGHLLANSFNEFLTRIALSATND